MRTPPREAMLLGLAFIIAGALVGYGGLKMGSGQVMVLIAAGAMAGGWR